MNCELGMRLNLVPPTSYFILQNGKVDNKTQARKPATFQRVTNFREKRFGYG